MTLDQRNSSKLLWAIIGGLIVIVLVVLSYQWMSQNQSAEATPEAELLRQPAAPAAKAKAEPAVQLEEVPQQLVSEDILKQPVATNATLAKEEMAKLEDLQAQLDDQAALLNAQHADADELIRLKEEQIQLLEAQLKQQ
ncbi:hypothetical protein [Acinetobacter indicus]|uniref:Uncharacterized protein n=1 Tax=Acinetobacter indicus TaxID=756892 RepID=A0AAW8Z6X7_9GAMM|nr:hypothetical protein [Acinetobacter indicus]MCO8087391.1 hypothetical protein [Acinetobacter indicus]MCO8098508.1 hypothetical protein [Acinetobacter indicus]MCO8101575.1 hypothetical protein [Acinetobacter indicus]MCO8104111.1 hypothetical protein [Acinetobacter indicus]MCO8109786.1 hypothetical protein [Acinetobacter indicus]